MNISIGPMLDFLNKCYGFLWNSAGQVLNIMSTSLNDLMGSQIDTPLLEWPIAAILCGAGFIAFLTVSLVKFFL